MAKRKIGLFCGEKKSENLGAFLQDFVRHMLDLQQGPVHIAGVCRPVDVKLASNASLYVMHLHVPLSNRSRVIVDIIDVKSVHKKDNGMAKFFFPDVNAPLKTDVLFDDMRYANHKTGQSPLQTLSPRILQKMSIIE